MPTTLQDRPMEFILSARATRCLAVKPERAASAPDPCGFLLQWRVEAVTDWCGRDWFMGTNLATLFTFLIPRQGAASFEEFVARFRTRLRFALLAANPPLEWDFTQAVPVSGNPRAVVGTMNEMARLVAYPRQPGKADLFADLEASMNRTPFSAIGTKGRYEFPGEQWLKKLNAISQASTGLDETVK